MENATKALTMAASVLLFILAISFSVYSYSKLIETVDSILTASENFTRTTESFEEKEINTTRVVSGAEVLYSILNMNNVNDYVFNKITVDGKEFSRDNVNEGALKEYVGTKNYKINKQDYNAKEIEYIVYD